MALAEANRRGGPDFSALPEGCIASVVSFTSPAEACRLASVSSVFKSACDSDVVWAAFFPPGCRQMVARRAPSLKELYFSLCDDPVLVADDKMSFSLDRHSGKKCIMLSARALSIVWSGTPIYWSWTCMPNSRFAEVAELIGVNYLKITGRISSCKLSPGTCYAAYLVFKFTPKSDGFNVRFRAGVAGDEAGKRERSVYFSRENIPSERQFWPFSTHTADADHDDGLPTPAPDEGNMDHRPKERPDGWSEIELGEFLTKDREDREVEMSVLETKRWKSGLIVEGFEIRPKVGIGH